jgi:hypothetical protein
MNVYYMHESIEFLRREIAFHLFPARIWLRPEMMNKEISYS